MTTVFVVGAGASTEFGPSFPVGTELASRIEARLGIELKQYRSGDAATIIHYLMTSGGVQSGHIAAISRIRDGIQSFDSIDDFINEWNDVPNIVDVAKLCITTEIYDAEKASSLFDILKNPADGAEVLRNYRESWLGKLVRYINPSSRRRDLVDSLSKAIFVTFNYDRTIEFYLEKYLRYVIGLNQVDVDAAIKSINIHHVYGRVPGSFCGDRKDNGRIWEYELNGCRDSIRTYTEEISSKTIKEISHSVSKAEKLVMLGMAYHRQNMDVLFSEGVPKCSAWATTFGLGQKRTAELISLFSGSGVSLTASPVRCGELIEQYRDEIFD